MTYPKRLIEVDLPIKRISISAVAEKKGFGGHPSMLHIWWARRPLAACRAVTCASLWPDPADTNCPPEFRDAALKQMLRFSKATQSNKELASICDTESWKRYKLLGDGKLLDLRKQNDLESLRSHLLDFVADFAAWEASTNDWFLDTARSLTQASHEALGGEKGTRPLVVDPFAGGGAIPLEALRIGADSFASDLNPVAALLNKVILEYVPTHGHKLADQVAAWGKWVNDRAKEELSPYYVKDADSSTPIAYIWARTITCEGPTCGAEVPLMRSLWLQKKGNRLVALRIVTNAKSKRVDFEIQENVRPTDVGPGTIRRGSPTCPCCGYTTPVSSVRNQLQAHGGGAATARLVAVVTTRPGTQGRFYRLPTQSDLDAVDAAGVELERLKCVPTDGISLVPEEPLPPQGTLGFRVQLYGMLKWGDLFTARQLLALTTFSRLVREAGTEIAKDQAPELADAVQACLALNLSKLADLATSLGAWEPNVPTVQHLFGRQAIPICWDFAEGVTVGDSRGSWNVYFSKLCDILRMNADQWHAGKVAIADAAESPLPNDSAACIVTDPPYYDAVPYAALSDFFYVWLRRSVPQRLAGWFKAPLTPKRNECIVDVVQGLDNQSFEKKMTEALSEARRVVLPSGIAVVVFAHKSTAGWEAQLQAMVSSGWRITASWPIDTELATRLRGMGSASLSSSVHLVCRPREDSEGELTTTVGDWRDVLAELPGRIREWMARLASESVVGADAIFACLGPALEIFSRYSRVEKASGEPALLKEYLTYVWGAVAQEALTQIFRGADATGFEEDARLTAMWLWTLNAGSIVETDDAELLPDAEDVASADDAEGASEEERGKAKGSGYILEYDAARKIAQGLGAHLEQMSDVVEVKGDKARLLSVSERTKKLFGKDEDDAPKPKGKKKTKQMSLGFMQEIEAAEAQGGWGDKSVPRLGDTVLDRIHQSMILFAAGRGEALRRFLVEDGAGQDQRFWKLANALSALYPQGTDEKRWVDGVLARKKGLGL